MNAPPGKSFLSPVLIGRASQLEFLDTVFTSKAPFRAIVVSGEAGIGKSRLLTEALTALRFRFATGTTPR